MTSKKLGALLRSVPPATATAEETVAPPAIVAKPPAPSVPAQATVAPSKSPPTRAAKPSIELEVPLQVLIPANVRRELAVKAAQEGESLRSLVLQAIRGLGVTVTDADIAGKRGRRNS